MPANITIRSLLPVTHLSQATKLTADIANTTFVGMIGNSKVALILEFYNNY